jgi:hypothetical protein
MGERATMRNATKWLKQSNPGLQPWVASKKDRPDEATEGWLARHEPSGSGLAETKDKPDFRSVALSGRTMMFINPGLKPWLFY